MKHILYSIIIALALTSCSAKKEVTTSTAYVERTATQVLDSVRSASLRQDSIYVRDSIYVHDRGDTVYIEKTKICYRWKTQIDTLYNNRCAVDTIYIEKASSEVRVEKSNSLARCARICVAIDCLCLLAILAICIACIRRKSV